MKKFYSLAILAAMLLLACTADGVFNSDPNNITWGGKSSSSGGAPPMSNSPGSDPLGYCDCQVGIPQSVCSALGGIFSATPCASGDTGSCTIPGACVEISEDGCDIGVFTPNGQCNVSTYVYCAYDRDCDLIGGNFTGSKSRCLERNDSFFATLAWCDENGYTPYDD